VEQMTRLSNNQSKVESNADLTPERLDRLWPASPKYRRGLPLPVPEGARIKEFRPDPLGQRFRSGRRETKAPPHPDAF
jgi:hypothetical protein